MTRQKIIFLAALAEFIGERLYLLEQSLSNEAEAKDVIRGLRSISSTITVLLSEEN